MGNKKNKPRKIEARLPKGMRDLTAGMILNRDRMLETIRRVYAMHGFAPLETPMIEYVDCLGKYLPESDEPGEGIFSFRYDDDQWVATRYDLTAPLARYYAQYQQHLPTPFRRYQVGPVFRNEKVKKGRFRQFLQFDFDSVGTGSMIADAEVCQTLSESLEALGFAPGKYKVLVNNRKILNGLLELGGIHDEKQQLIVLRAIDKLDRLGLNEVVLLLQQGREDESGDVTPGAGLSDSQVESLLGFLRIEDGRETALNAFAEAVGQSEAGKQGVAELQEIHQALEAFGLGEDRIVFSARIVRGLEYYTGPVFEVELTDTVPDEKTGDPVALGAVAAGGRYDSLVKSFTGQQTPATGASIGVDRLAFAMSALGMFDDAVLAPPVLVTVMDKERLAEYQKMVADLRRAGIAAEIFAGTGKFAKQMRYADQRGSAVAVIAGPDEFEKGELTLKDLIVGRKLASEISEREQWLKEQPSQWTISADHLVVEIRKVLDKHGMS